MKDQKYYDDLDRRIEMLLANSIEDRKKAERFSEDLKILTERQDREYAMVKESVGLRGKYAEEVA